MGEFEITKGGKTFVITTPGDESPSMDQINKFLGGSPETPSEQEPQPNIPDTSHLMGGFDVSKISGEDVQGLIEPVSDIGLGVAGSIYGGKLGATVGTLVAPGPGTIVGGFIGSVAGGMASAAGSELLTSYTDSVINDKDMNAEDVVKNMVSDAKSSAVIDVALSIIVPGAKGTIKTGANLIPETFVKKLKDIRLPMEQLNDLVTKGKELSEYIFRNEKEINDIRNNYSRVKTAADVESKRIDDLLYQTTREAEDVGSKFDAGITQVTKENETAVKNLVDPLMQSFGKAEEQFKKYYGLIKKAYGDKPVNIADELDQLGQIIDEVGFDAFDSTTLSKINKLRNISEEVMGKKQTAITPIMDPTSDYTVSWAVQPLPKKNVVKRNNVYDVADAIEFKQDLFDISRSIFERKGGSASKSGVGQKVQDIIASVDGKLNRATNGQTAKVNKGYNGYKTITDINKSIIKNARGETGQQIADRLSMNRVSKILQGNFEKLSKVDQSVIDSISDGRKSITDFQTQSIDNLFTVPESLIYTGNPELVQQGKQMLQRISEVQDHALSVSNLKNVKKDFVEFTEGFVESVKGMKPDRKAIEIAESNAIAGFKDEILDAQLQHRNLMSQAESIGDKLNVSKDVITDRFLALTAANTSATVPGRFSNNIAAGFRALGYLGAIKNMSPVMSGRALNTIEKLRGMVVNVEMPTKQKVFLSKVLNHYYQKFTEENK